LVLEQADPAVPRCEYRIARNPQATYAVTRTRYGTDGRPIGQQRLASDLTTATMSQLPEGAFALEIAAHDGFDAFHSTQHLIIYAVPDSLATVFAWTGREETNR